MSMEIRTLHGIWYVVEVNGETHYVPPGCCSLDIPTGETMTREIMQDNLAADKGKEDDEQADARWAEMIAAIHDYCEADATLDSVESIEARECWGAQYHMPGYMDQTDWVLGDTEEEAVKECKELYGDEDEEEDEELDDDDAFDPDAEADMEDDPVYPDEGGCEYLRTWEEGDFKLILWDTNTRTHSGPQERLAYQFFHKGELIFSGADYGCAPSHAVDSDDSVAALLSFLALQPGDTDREYFKDYTLKQMAFALAHGEELSIYAMELEEGAQKDEDSEDDESEYGDPVG